MTRPRAEVIADAVKSARELAELSERKAVLVRQLESSLALEEFAGRPIFEHGRVRSYVIGNTATPERAEFKLEQFAGRPPILAAWRSAVAFLAVIRRRASRESLYGRPCVPGRRETKGVEAVKHVCNISVCADCLEYLANGGAELDPETVARIEAGLAREVPSHIVAGSEDLGFSWSPCELCESLLGGERYSAGVLEEESRNAI